MRMFQFSSINFTTASIRNRNWLDNQMARKRKFKIHKIYFIRKNLEEYKLPQL